MKDLDTNLEIGAHLRSCLADYLEINGIDPARFKSRISDEDEMFHNTVAKTLPLENAYFKYLESGRRTRDAMQQVYDHFFDGPGGVGAFLEFASGHGRATRFMTLDIDPKRYFASDIYADAMTFQRDYFGVNTVLSAEHPDEFACDRKFDLITVMSLFTHLPDALFGPWLAKLASLLTKDGILLFSAREASTVPDKARLDGIDDGGIAYELRSESNSLSKDIYGLTTVTDSYVRDKIRSFVSPKARVQAFPRGIFVNQALYAVSMRRAKNFTPLKLKRPPTGDRGPKWVTLEKEGKVQIGGWCVDLNPGGDIKSVEISINGKPCTTAEFTEFNNQEAFDKYFHGLSNTPHSWRVQLPADLVTPEAIIRADVTNTAGARIEYYLPRFAPPDL